MLAESPPWSAVLSVQTVGFSLALAAETYHGRESFSKKLSGNLLHLELGCPICLLQYFVNAGNNNGDRSSATSPPEIADPCKSYYKLILYKYSMLCLNILLAVKPSKRDYSGESKSSVCQQWHAMSYFALYADDIKALRKEQRQLSKRIRQLRKYDNMVRLLTWIEFQELSEAVSWLFRFQFHS